MGGRRRRGAGRRLRTVVSAGAAGVAGAAVMAFGLMGVTTGAAAAGARTASTPSTARSYYLALGDSVPVWDGTHSYAHLLENHYGTRLAGLHLRDMAVSEATTTSMLEGGQYQAALAFLGQHVGHMALITIDNGGNDLLPCASAAGIDATCLDSALATVQSNMTTMLAGLRAAAPGVPIVGMSYYDPFLGDWLAGGATRTLALDTLPVVADLNTELTTLYGGPSQTADVSKTFKTAKDATMVGSRWGRVPVDVARACAWLDIRCHRGAAEGFGDDPNVAGQKKIASTFEETIGKLQAPT